MSLLSCNRLARVAIVLSTTAALGMPASASAQSVSATRKPFEAFSNSAHSLRDSIVLMAKAQIGTKYRSGGQSPKKGFDCSGLVKYIMAALKLDVPRTARQQAGAGLAVNKDTSRLMPGDLLTFGKGKQGNVSHVGIYIGEGKYIHASSVAGKVIESKIDRPGSSLVRMWKGARRVLSSSNDSASTVTVATTKGGGGR